MTVPLLPAIVDTRIVHIRTTPVTHRFAYRSLTWLVDLDHLPDLAAPLRPFARFRPDDHFPEPAAPDDTLRRRLDNHLQSAGVTPTDGQVTALMSPRVAGYVFNPLSIFWCHRADGTLAHVVAEVHNTYGGRHSYVVDVGQNGRATVDKHFYVSPFNDVSGRYELRVPEIDAHQRIRVSVTLTRPGHGPFTATLSGTATPATPGRVILSQLTTPLAPLVVAARIRLHGIRLWLRGLPIVPRPHQQRHITVADQGRKEA